MADKKPYLRWHPALPDNISFRGENLDSLNRRTFESIYEDALRENDAMPVEGKDAKPKA